MPSLFPTDVESAFETMALAFHEKNKWDARWFKIQILIYSIVSSFLSMFVLTLVEWFFGFNLFSWLFGV